MNVDGFFAPRCPSFKVLQKSASSSLTTYIGASQAFLRNTENFLPQQKILDNMFLYMDAKQIILAYVVIQVLKTIQIKRLRDGIYLLEIMR